MKSFSLCKTFMAAAGLCLLTGAGSLAAEMPADLVADLEQADLAHIIIYGRDEKLSCAKKQELRESLIEITQTYRLPNLRYKAQRGELYTLSPQLKPEHKAQVEELFATMPDYIRSALYESGVISNFVLYGLKESDDTLSSNTNFVIGTYRLGHIAATFALTSDTVNEEGQRGFWYPPEPMPQTYYHEVGHMIDYLFANYDGEHTAFSERALFTQAYEADMAAFAARRESLCPDDIQPHAYYLPQDHNGTAIRPQLPHEDEVRPVAKDKKELFAELWQHHVRGGRPFLGQNFPRSLAVVAQVDQYLQDFYRDPPVPCVYLDDGTALTPLQPFTLPPATPAQKF
ncbi:MAG: hypothetical protein KJ667_07315 [Alphaproteobacteria bacterium]|nr:hypothetical protein [Alphaproteobacteria bacterium]